MSKWLKFGIFVLFVILVVNTIALIIVSIFDNPNYVRYDIILATGSSIDVLIIFLLVMLTMMGVFGDNKHNLSRKLPSEKHNNSGMVLQNLETRRSNKRKNLKTIYENMYSNWTDSKASLLAYKNGTSYIKPNTKTIYENIYTNWTGLENIENNRKYGSTDVRYNTKAQYENTYSDWAISDIVPESNRYVVLKTNL